MLIILGESAITVRNIVNLRRSKQQTANQQRGIDMIERRYEIVVGFDTESKQWACHVMQLLPNAAHGDQLLSFPTCELAVDAAREFVASLESDLLPGRTRGRNFPEFQDMRQIAGQSV